MIVEPRGCVAILVALSVLPLGCGSTKKVTRNDVSTVRALLNATAAVQKAVEPLYACRPQKPDCYRRSGPALSVVAARQKARLTAALRETDNSCLKKTSGVVVQDLDAYLGAGRAATAGDPIRAEKELARSTDLEIAYEHRICTCGFTQGRLHEIASRVRLANAAILRLGDEMRACRTVPCVHRVARRLGQEAGKGISNLDEFSLSAGSDIPQCV